MDKEEFVATILLLGLDKVWDYGRSRGDGHNRPPDNAAAYGRYWEADEGDINAVPFGDDQVLVLAKSKSSESIDGWTDEAVFDYKGALEFIKSFLHDYPD